MKSFLIKYFNGMMVSAVRPLNKTDREFADEMFARGVKEIALYDELQEILCLQRSEHKKNLYKVSWEVSIPRTKNGATLTKHFKRDIFIYADSETEAINWYNVLNGGNCYYSNKPAANIKAEVIDEADPETPCFTALK